jgi:hypothetical protein
MKNRNTVLLPKLTKAMAILGENIKLARLRHKLQLNRWLNVQALAAGHWFL